jgi:hypothetical protein
MKPPFLIATDNPQATPAREGQKFVENYGDGLTTLYRAHRFEHVSPAKTRNVIRKLDQLALTPVGIIGDEAKMDHRSPLSSARDASHA